MAGSVAQLAENLRQVRGRMAEAALRSGREPGEVTLVAVTKYASEFAARTLADLGCLDLGESRPQALWQKAGALGIDPIRWHLIGHLQRNKVRQTLPLVTLIHSADSLRLIRTIDEEASRQLGRAMPILLEVNISGEPAKHGFAPAEMEPLGKDLAALEHIEVRGLMTMAGQAGGLDRARRDFAALRALRDRLRAAWPPELASGELSMGMSGDFEAAIEEGATMVRVGSALFEGVE